MDLKKNIIENLNKLKITYYNQIDKKWQIIALTNAINNIEEYEEEIISGENLKNNIKGIGKKISNYIDEIIKYGYIKDLYNKKIEEDSYEEFMQLIGVGKSKAKEWINKGIKNIEDLRNEIRLGNISITNNIELGLKYFEDLKNRIPKKEIDILKNILKKIFLKINNDIIFEICGSYRRNNIDSGDIDVLITHPNYNSNEKNYKNYDYFKNILDSLRKNNIIVDSMTKNCTKKFLGMCIIPNYKLVRRIDIMYIDYKSYYSSILYFTGNKYFNLYIRNKCLEKNYSLNEYFLTDLNNGEKIYLKNEKEIFDILQIEYLNPNERNFSNNKK